jgi:hypothetical protein
MYPPKLQAYRTKDRNLVSYTNANHLKQTPSRASLVFSRTVDPTVSRVAAVSVVVVMLVMMAMPVMVSMFPRRVPLVFFCLVLNKIAQDRATQCAEEAMIFLMP